MKKIIYLVLVLLMTSCGSDNTPGISGNSSQGVGASSARGAAESILSGMGKGKYAEGELLVKFKSGVVAASSSKTNRAVGAASLRRFSVVPNLEHVKLPAGLSVQDAIKQYMNDPTVEYAEPNYLKRASMKADDPYFGQQWALLNTGQAIEGISGISGADVKATQAWDITTGSRNVIVAVLDTGIDSTHPDFFALDHSSNIVQGYNYIAGNTNTTDDNGHGTHVSGIIGAVGNNGTGIAGIMWGVHIMPVKFLDATGTGSTADEISAIQFAVANGAKIMNASFAGGSFSCSEYYAIAKASSSGVLLMAAAGNGGGSLCDSGIGADTDTSPCYPASFSNPNDKYLNNPSLRDPGECTQVLPALANIISVASTDQSDNKSTFSNYGLNSVQVAAPGENILSTVPLSLGSPFCDGSPWKGYEFCNGTSMATPFVSGLAGLIYSQNPNLSYSQVRSIILNSVDPLPSLSGQIMTGGRINAFRALTSQSFQAISVSPASADFGSVNVGSTSSPQTFTVSNSGTANLVIGQIALSGSNASEFSLSNDGCSGQTVAPQSNCTVQAKFSPASAGSKSAAISIPSNDTASPVKTISLAGTAIASKISVSPASADFGSVNVGSTSSPQTFTVSNSGTANLVIGQIALSGSNASEFSLSNDGCSGQTVAPQSNCTVQAKFSPASAGSKSAAISIPSNDTASPTVTVSLTGTGASPSPSGSSGGGCSIGGKENASSAVADSAVLLIPFIAVALLRRRRQ